ncbi:hypothetical protein XFF6992_80055 [Xanthomonas citri pv. fuscans]|nr:hypothetical protein XFF6992_80055 [Xanthomonas citri pv. fuscans]SOO35166.1 hypothetical protein XFF6994_510010 [Xanthomonas citri pv. fuscans]
MGDGRLRTTGGLRADVGRCIGAPCARHAQQDTAAFTTITRLVHGQVLDAEMRAFCRMPSDSTSVALIDSLSQHGRFFCFGVPHSRSLDCRHVCRHDHPPNA